MKFFKVDNPLSGIRKRSQANLVIFAILCFQQLVMDRNGTCEYGGQSDRNFGLGLEMCKERTNFFDRSLGKEVSSRIS